MTMIKAGLTAAFLAIFLLFPSGRSESALEPAPVCFDEPYDYTYRDDRLLIAINRFEEPNLVYFVADVQVLDATVLQAALSGGKPYGREEPVSVIAARNQAILAINADDYGVHKNGVIIRNGELIRADTTSRNMLIVESNGDMSVHTDRRSDKPKALAEDLLSRGVWQTFEFGPELVRSGKAAAFSKDFDLIATRDDQLEPRTAIGQIEPLHYVVIVVDGRQDSYSRGVSLRELQELFLRFGAYTAMNLDGGGSAELWFRGEILNKPSGGKERAVTDVIMFK